MTSAPNAIRILLERKPTPEVLTSLLTTTHEETTRAAALLNESEVSEAKCIGFDRIKAVGVNSTLIIGGLLQLHHAIAYGRRNPNLFDDLLEDLNIPLASAHRSMQIFRGFGAYLLKEPKLLAAFTGVAPLDVLSMRQTDPRARDEAIERARKGELIDTNAARALKAKYCEAAAPSAEELPRLHEASCEPTASPKWKFIGRFIRAKQVKLNCRDASILQEVVKELETALQEIRALLAPRISVNRAAE